MVIVLILGEAFAIRAYFPKYEPVEVKVEMEAPVMDKIMQCESNGKHFGSDGQIKTNVNTDGSIDIGIFQINLAIWGKIAGTKGYDLTKEADNRAFAMYLYKNFGTGHWSSSSKCWNK